MATISFGSWVYPVISIMLLPGDSLAQPTQCQPRVFTTIGCIDSHPWLCIGANEEEGSGFCATTSTGNCCCVNAAGTLSSICDDDGTHNLCCDGHCLDPEEWECCGEEKCLKETHTCLQEESICVQKTNPGLDIPVLAVLGTVWCCCCLCCFFCGAKIWLPRCAFTTLLVGAFLLVLGFATWDTTGPMDRRPLVLASIVMLPLGLLALCCTACIKDDSGNNLLWASINERVVTRIVDTKGNVIEENVQVKQANHVASLPQQINSGHIRGLAGQNLGRKEENHTTIHAPPTTAPTTGGGRQAVTVATPSGGQAKNKIEIC